MEPLSPRPPAARRPLPLRLQTTCAVLLAAVLAGCVPQGEKPYFKLIDQRMFRGPALPPSEADIARGKLPPLPLVTIRFDQPDADYHDGLAAAIEAAQAAKPDVAFDVLAPVPVSASQDVQARFTEQGAADAQAVATALAADGVDPGRVHIGFRGDPGSPPREVRVYARVERSQLAAGSSWSLVPATITIQPFV